MKILAFILIALLFFLSLADAFFIAALWVIHKLNKEEIEDYEKHELQK
jgi:hypothetical protein